MQTEPTLHNATLLSGLAPATALTDPAVDRSTTIDSLLWLYVVLACVGVRHCGLDGSLLTLRRGQLVCLLLLVVLAVRRCQRRADLTKDDSVSMSVTDSGEARRRPTQSICVTRAAARRYACADGGARADASSTLMDSALYDTVDLHNEADNNTAIYSPAPALAVNTAHYDTVAAPTSQRYVSVFVARLL